MVPSRQPLGWPGGRHGPLFVGGHWYPLQQNDETVVHVCRRNNKIGFLISDCISVDDATTKMTNFRAKPETFELESFPAKRSELVAGVKKREDERYLRVGTLRGSGS